jgi:deoxyribodipyrimidine photo-lyase
LATFDSLRARQSRQAEQPIRNSIQKMLEENPRVRAANHAPVSPGGDYVLYWMTAFRRVSWNHSLDRAVAWSRELGKPLVVLEALRCDYPWASDRFHKFVLDGMVDDANALNRNHVTYYPYVEPEQGAGKGLLSALANRACVVVTDDYPAFFLPRMIEAAASKLAIRLEAVDSNGLIPLSRHEKVYSSAYHFRRFLHGTLQEESIDLPKQRPFAGKRLATLEQLPTEVLSRWGPTDADDLLNCASLFDRLPIDHNVQPVAVKGGRSSGRSALKRFLDTRLPDYGEKRNHPEADATSGLSPYLHFGHLSVHEIVHAVFERREWTPGLIEPAARGRKAGWWGLDENAEAFLDELVTWRELGFNAAEHQPAFDSFESLPEWVQTTLGAHATDIRTHIYSYEQFESGETHDQIWNAAQCQLLQEGRIHGYLRMLWGKKVLEWSPTAQHAFQIMVDLNNKYALDGRDPNSYTGILWVLGKYDRPWAPERPVFGTVRYMSSDNTARKFKLGEYLRRYSPQTDSVS